MSELLIKPLVQAVLVADHVYQDTQTGKFVVCGILGRVHCDRSTVNDATESGSGSVQGRRAVIIPKGGLKWGSPFLYWSVTEVHRTQLFTIRYVQLATDRVMFELPVNLSANDPMQVVQSVIPLPELPMIGGHYALEVIWNNEILGAHRIEIVDTIVEPER
ncbi:MAG: hypothetical protein KDA58_14645 [Planctomycetaceae bacterium]|nr:hypothetical protein [Planctomycetaceae bacterium]